MMYYIDDRWIDDHGMEIPMPGRSHDDMGDFCLPEGYHKNEIFQLEWSPEASKNDWDKTVEKTAFWRRRYVGPAPFVGETEFEMAYYVWDAWVAADGRWIGGAEATMMWRYT